MSHALAWLGVVSILLKLDKVDSPRAPRSKKNPQKLVPGSNGEGRLDAPTISRVKTTLSVLLTKVSAKTTTKPYLSPSNLKSELADAEKGI